MTTEQIIALVSLVSFLLVQTSIMAYYAGQLSGKVNELDNGLKEANGHIELVEEKIAEHQTYASEHFVTSGQCDLVNKNWESRLTSILANRDLRDVQNQKDHEALLLQCTNTSKTLVKMNECLHSLDKRFPG